jgi:uncharacterized membrane protein
MPEHTPDGQREEIHLPGPSLLPLVTALGITIALLGLPFSLWFSAAGVAIALVAVVRWVVAVRRELDELPTERR